MKYVGHSDTSYEAAVAIIPETSRLRLLVYDLLSQYPVTGRTDLEMQEELNMAGSTQRPRRVELCDMGLVIDSGKRRLTHSGRSAAVWIIKPILKPSDLGL